MNKTINWHRLKTFLLILSIVVSIGGCGAVSLENRWQDASIDLPDRTGKLSLGYRLTHLYLEEYEYRASAVYLGKNIVIPIVPQTSGPPDLGVIYYKASKGKGPYLVFDHLDRAQTTHAEAVDLSAGKTYSNTDDPQAFADILSDCAKLDSVTIALIRKGSGLRTFKTDAL